MTLRTDQLGNTPTVGNHAADHVATNTQVNANTVAIAGKLDSDATIVDLRKLTGDGTAALQAAFDLLSTPNTFVRVLLPESLTIGGPCRLVSAGYSAQIIVPHTAGGFPLASMSVIELVGLGHGDAVPYAPAGGTSGASSSTAGSLIVSSGVGPLAGTVGSVFGVQNNTYSHIMVATRDITIRLDDDPLLGGLAFDTLGAFRGYGLLRVDTPADTATTVEPTHATRAIDLPGLNNGGGNMADEVIAQGFYEGVAIGEHIDIRNLAVFKCIRGLVVKQSFHGGQLGYCSLMWCSSMVIAGPSAGISTWTPLDFGIVDFEETLTAGLWYTTLYHFDDASNHLRGRAYWVRVLPGTGQVHTLLLNGATGLTLTDMTVAASGLFNQNILVGTSDNQGLAVDAQAAARLGIIKKSGLNPAIVSDSGSPILFYQSNQTGVQTSISSATFTELMRLTTTGLGIGKTASTKLDVNGTITGTLFEGSGASLTSIPAGSVTGTLPVAKGGTGVTSSTGTGSTVLSTSPTLVTPALGTPASGVATNLTGTASGLTAGNVTTNANLTGDVTSVGNATTLTNAPVIAKVLTGYTSGAGTVAATDSILQAIQKLNGNDATNANLTGPIASSGNATSITSQSGTGTTFAMSAGPTFTGTVTAAAITASGVVTPSAGIAPISPFTIFGTAGMPNFLNTSSGASATTANGTIFWCVLPIRHNATLTGLTMTGMANAGADKWIYALYSSTGVLLANTALAGTNAPTTAVKLSIPFTATVAVTGPAVYYAAIQTNGNTNKFQAFANAGEQFVTGSVAGTFGTLPSITPGTTYAANIGPYATTY